MQSLKLKFRSERRRYAADLQKYIFCCLEYKNEEKKLFYKFTEDKNQLTKCLDKY